MPVVLDETKKKCSRLFIKENVFKLLKADLIPVLIQHKLKERHDFVALDFGKTQTFLNISINI